MVKALEFHPVLLSPLRVTRAMASGGHLAKIVSLHQKTPTFTRGHVDAFVMRNAGSEMASSIGLEPTWVFQPPPHPRSFTPQPLRTPALPQSVNCYVCIQYVLALVRPVFSSGSCVKPRSLVHAQLNPPCMSVCVCVRVA